MHPNASTDLPRAVVRNALLWAFAWAAIGALALAALWLAGFAPATASLPKALGLVARFGIVGAVSGAAFTAIAALAFRGRRASEIHWVRAGLVGAIFAAVFVPLFLQTMNILSGDGLVAWKLVLDDSVWAAVFGGVAAVAATKFARRR